MFPEDDYPSRRHEPDIVLLRRLETSCLKLQPSRTFSGLLLSLVRELIKGTHFNKELFCIEITTQVTIAESIRLTH
jgi:hypothetical protein